MNQQLWRRLLCAVMVLMITSERQACFCSPTGTWIENDDEVVAPVAPSESSLSDMNVNTAAEAARETPEEKPHSIGPGSFRAAGNAGEIVIEYETSSDEQEQYDRSDEVQTHRNDEPAAADRWIEIGINSGDRTTASSSSTPSAPSTSSGLSPAEFYDHLEHIPGEIGEQVRLERLMDNEGMFGGDVPDGIGLNLFNKTAPGETPGNESANPFKMAIEPYLKYTYWTNGTLIWEIHKTAAGVRGLVLEAIKEIESKTCIRFLERSSAPEAANFVNITDNPGRGGCWSHVGMRRNGSQELNLQYKGCWNKGTVIHELVHAIGFYHEHQRFDRDKYVEIKLKNVAKGREGNFRKTLRKQTRNVCVPYDYESIMHYGSTAFGRRVQCCNLDPPFKVFRTIRPRKRGVKLEHSSKHPRLSPLDAKEINLVYAGVCPPELRPRTNFR